MGTLGLQVGTLGLQVGEFTGHGVQEAAYSLARLGLVRHSIIDMFSFRTKNLISWSFANAKLLVLVLKAVSCNPLANYQQRLQGGPKFRFLGHMYNTMVLHQTEHHSHRTYNHSKHSGIHIPYIPVSCLL